MQKGGDGYVIDVNESIGGMAGHTRYSNNYRPIFEGQLLRGGNNNNTNNTNNANNHNENQSDKSIYEIIMEQQNKKKGMSGGGFTPFPAIQSISQILAPLGVNALISLVILMGLYDIKVKKPNLKKQMGGYSSSLTEILAPLGKNNLIVVVAILLLHTFSVKRLQEKKSMKSTKIKKGGFFLEKEISDILNMVGLNKNGKNSVLQKIDSFIGSHESSIQTGGKSSTKNSYVANGLIHSLQKLFVYKIKETNEKDIHQKSKAGEKVIHAWNKIFHTITPLSFSAFGTKSFLRDVVENKENYKKYIIQK